MRIGIIFGGPSREREISFAGGRTIYDNLNKELFEAVPIFVDSNRQFMLAAIHKNLGSFDDSIIEAQKIIDAPQQTVGIYAIEQFATRPLAAHLLLQATIEQSLQVENDSEKKAFVVQAEKYFEFI